MARRRSVSLFSFSFLDIFACTLGALIFILAACALLGQESGRASARAIAAEIERLEEERDPAEYGALADRIAFFSGELRASRERARQAAESLAEAKAKLKRAEEAAAYTWVRLPRRVGDRTPVYLECRDDLIVRQPGGKAMDWESLHGKDTPLRKLLAELRTDKRRYPVLILRSSGYKAYVALEGVCQGLALEYARQPLPDRARVEGWTR